MPVDPLHNPFWSIRSRSAACAVGRNDSRMSLFCIRSRRGFAMAKFKGIRLDSSTNRRSSGRSQNGRLKAVVPLSQSWPGAADRLTGFQIVGRCPRSLRQLVEIANREHRDVERWKIARSFRPRTRRTRLHRVVAVNQAIDLQFPASPVEHCVGANSQPAFSEIAV